MTATDTSPARSSTRRHGDDPMRIRQPAVKIEANLTLLKWMTATSIVVMLAGFGMVLLFVL
jgi:hypothetical protein